MTFKTCNAKVIAAVQNVLESMVEDVKVLELPELGPAFSGLSGTDLHDALVAHRLTKTFQRPSSKATKTRRDRSIQGFLATDAQVASQFDYWDLDPAHRRAFLMAREWVHKLLKGLRPSYQAIFPTGETVISMRGETDLFVKLSSKEQWTVSIDCIDYASHIAYKTLYLKRLVRSKFRDEAGHRARRLMRRWWEEGSGLPYNKRAFRVFSRMFAYCCDIVGYSRVTTVPKNNEKDRVITCEPLWNMVAQLSLAHDLRERLRTRTGIDIRFWQNVHRALIRSGKATIDFSDASNRNSWAVVRQLFPQHTVELFRQVRTGVFVYSDDAEGDQYAPSNMFAPMGTGMTFDVLTITLLAYARYFDPSATTFGDDVIIDPTRAEDFISFTEALGWKVNKSKSFIAGNFRESCGAFADLKNQRLLPSYDLHWPETMADCFIQANKISVLIDHMEKSSLWWILVKTFDTLHSILPSDAFWWDGSDELWDWKFRTRERPRAQLVTTPLVLTWSEQWTRNIRLVRRVVSILGTQPLRRDLVDQLHAGCFLHRGRCYAVPTGKSKLAVRTVDALTGVPVSQVQLVSVI